MLLLLPHQSVVKSILQVLSSLSRRDGVSDVKFPMYVFISGYYLGLPVFERYGKERIKLNVRRLYVQSPLRKYETVVGIRWIMCIALV